MLVSNPAWACNKVFGVPAGIIAKGTENCSGLLQYAKAMIHVLTLNLESHSNVNTSCSRAEKYNSDMYWVQMSVCLCFL